MPQISPEIFRLYFDVVVIGGGAAGLMCALTAAQRGKRVVVLEGSNKLGKKILMSGGGRCNFTNLDIHSDHYVSNNSHFCKSALSQFTQWDFIDLVEQHKIRYHEKKQGQLFCDGSSKEILSMLVNLCRAAHVTLLTRCNIHNLESQQEDNHCVNYSIYCNDKVYDTSSLVIASGGLSIPSMGASGLAYQIAQQFDIPCVDTRAGLVPLIFSGEIKSICHSLSGNSCHAAVSSKRKQFIEDILFTHRGLSGPAILQISNYWLPGESIHLNLFPNLNLCQEFKRIKAKHPNRKLSTLIGRHQSKNLTRILQNVFWSDCAELAITEIANERLVSLADALHNWSLQPDATEGYRTAEVTLGGVDTRFISSKTMECVSHKGLYFIGEALDVSGELGGYNFQWAWSSAYVAAQNV